MHHELLPEIELWPIDAIVSIHQTIRSKDGSSLTKQYVVKMGHHKIHKA